MRSLDSLDNITVGVISLPPWSGGNIPYARVAHSKYLITDKVAYIGTSNWTPDYFLQTGGVSITFALGKERNQVLQVFYRDWTSNYTSPLPPPGVIHHLENN